MAVLGDTAAIGIDDVIAATFDGELVALDRALDRVFAEGGNPVQLVRSLQRHADQLHLVSGHARGGNFEGAMFKARSLPRGGPVRQRFERHLRSWPLPRLSQALSRILDAEIDCKKTGLPDEAIARRLCLALAQAARQTRARR
jgi:DNA polymerase-3 subunit delta